MPAYSLTEYGNVEEEKRREGGGWKKTHRGQHNDEKGCLADSTFPAALWNFNSAATTKLKLFSSFARLLRLKI